MKMNIRKAMASDVTSVSQMLEALDYPQISPTELNKTLNEILNSKNMGILLACVDSGEAAGMISFSHKPLLRLKGYSLEIDELVVLPKFRGSGAGHALVDEIKKIAKGLGIQRIVLSTKRERESYKRGFYFKNGFTEVDSAWLRIELKT